MTQCRIILVLQPITKLYLFTIVLKLRDDFRCFRSKMCFRTFSTVSLNSPMITILQHHYLLWSSQKHCASAPDAGCDCRRLGYWQILIHVVIGSCVYRMSHAFEENYVTCSYCTNHVGRNETYRRIYIEDRVMVTKHFLQHNDTNNKKVKKVFQKCITGWDIHYFCYMILSNLRKLLKSTDNIRYNHYCFLLFLP